MKEILLSQHGILPGEEIAGRLARLFQEHPRDTVFRFAPGVYHLSPGEAAAFSVSLSNSDQLPVLKAGLPIFRMENVRVEGNGATLLCHGQISPIALMDSENIRVEGLTIDYSPSQNAEGTILRASPQWVDVSVDKAAYPYEVRGERLYFFSGETDAAYFGAIEFEAVSRRAAYRKGDRFRSKRQEEIAPGVIRFHGSFDPLPTPGNLLTLRHSPRIHPGILVHHCGDVSLADITLHNTCGLGVLTQFSRDVRYERICMRPNEAAGRRIVSCHDDGLHFSNNAGRIVVEGCYFHGLMDDPINVHGTALRIRKITGRRSLTAEFAHDQSIAFPLWAQKGDRISLIEHRSMASMAALATTQFELLSGNACALSFEGELPEGLKPGDALENLNNTPAVEIRGCYFGSCRARGVLVSTPEPVVIENNVFESAGSAILIPGDANQWFESGACHDVIIRHNHFTDACLTSMYQFCEGIISICPEIPDPRPGKPFHSNIRIEENTFHAFDAPLLYALSTAGLTFLNNTVIRSRAYAPWHPRQAMATLVKCSEVSIGDNRFVGDVWSKEVVEKG